MDSAENPRNLDWWELWPITEHSRRPIAWSQSSIVFTAHATQPVVEARLFPSGKAVIIRNPPFYEPYNAYRPPTVITISPCDEWLFAYFPHQAAGGLACLWKKGNEVDQWTIKEFWSCATAVLTASWLGGPREWAVVDSPGSAVRLPLRGPPVPLSDPTLLLVTQLHEMHICYFKYNQSLKIHRISLLEHSLSSTALSPSTDSDALSDALSAAGVRVCTDAVIGLGYGERSILVVTRSQTLPSGVRIHYDLNESLQQLPAFDDSPPIEWDTWSPESFLFVSEIKILSKGQDYVVAVQPLTSLHCDAPLTTLSIIAHPGRCQKKGDDVKWLPETAVMYLTATACDVNDYNTPPSSDIYLYTIKRKTTEATPSPRLTFELTTRRTFQSGVIGFVVGLPHNLSQLFKSSIPGEPTLNPPILAICLLHTSTTPLPAGTTRKQHEQSGEIVALSDDLSKHPEWTSSKITSSATSLEKTPLPLNVVVSPNGAVICSLDSTSSMSTPSLFFQFPRPKAAVYSVSLSASLTTALKARLSPSDLVHILSLPSTSEEDVVAALSQTLTFFGPDNGESDPSSWLKEVLGVSVEVYKTRSARSRTPEAHETYAERSKMAHGFCSVISNSENFNRFRLPDGTFHLGPIWTLIDITTWSVNFLEQVIKDCITSGDISHRRYPKDASSEDEDKLFDSTLLKAEKRSTTPRRLTLVADTFTEPSAALLHFAHPSALRNIQQLLRHVKDLHAQITTGVPNTEAAKLAQDVVLDLIDNSGIDLKKLDSLLSETLEDVQKLDAQHMLKSLASCKLVPELYPSVGPILAKIAQSPAIDKVRLFVKPGDLVDGFSDLRVSDNRDTKIDVITKAELPPSLSQPCVACIRCGARSQALGFQVCVCGGRWVTAS